MIHSPTMCGKLNTLEYDNNELNATFYGCKTKHKLSSDVLNFNGIFMTSLLCLSCLYLSIFLYLSLSRRYTSKKTTSGTSVYAVVLKWPNGASLTLGAPTPSANTRATLLGYTGSFLVKKRPMGGMDIMIPPIPANKMPCQWGWVFRLEHLA